MGDDFKITEPKLFNPKLKIINDKEEFRLEEENLIDIIVKQNEIDNNREDFYLKVIKKIVIEDKSVKRSRGGRREFIIN